MCSGSTSCLDNSCRSNRECTACAIELLDLYTDAATFFSIETLSTLPNETTLKFDATTNNYQLYLPTGYCPETCSQDVVIISGTNDVDYIIDSKSYLPVMYHACMVFIVYVLGKLTYESYNSCIYP